MKLDKKQLPQIIVLGILVTICVCVVSFQILAPQRSVPPAPVNKPASEKESENNICKVQEESNSDEALMEGVTVFPNITSTPVRRDPFVPQISELKENVAPAAKPKQAPAVKIKPSPRRIARDLPPLTPAIRVKPLEISQPNGSAMVSGPSEIKAPQQDPQFVLTGVVRGEQNVAIMRVGESRYIVREGQLIDGRYKVISVKDDCVVLVNESRRIYVRLGGDKNAS